MSTKAKLGDTTSNGEPAGALGRARRAVGMALSDSLEAIGGRLRGSSSVTSARALDADESAKTRLRRVLSRDRGQLAVDARAQQHLPSQPAAAAPPLAPIAPEPAAAAPPLAPIAPEPAPAAGASASVTPEPAQPTRAPVPAPAVVKAQALAAAVQELTQAAAAPANTAPARTAPPPPPPPRRASPPPAPPRPAQPLAPALRTQPAVRPPPPPPAAVRGNAPKPPPTPATLDDDDEEGEPIRTRSMARLLASQGHHRRALAIYDAILAEGDEQPGLRAEADALRARAAP